MPDGPAFLTASEWDDLRTTLHLSPREGHVLSLIILGLQDRRIAAQCGISVDTVRTHVRRIYTKVGANSRSQLIVRIFESHVALRRNART